MGEKSRTVVITGASSGIGRATALAFAKQGYHVVLAARSEPELQKVAMQCQQYGITALAVPADVSRQEDVEQLADQAAEHYGGFDVWVNNAGVTSVGAFEETTPDAFRHVVETNFFGSVYGARAALRQFSKQQHGTLITISSVFGVVPSPFESAYVASKFALRGFSASLRQELQLTGHRDIHVCTVLPAAIDTPIYRNAANSARRSLQPPPPLYSPELVARAIVGLAQSPQDEVIIGGSGKMMQALRVVMPGWLFDRLFAGYIQRAHFTGRQSFTAQGNLQLPSPVTKVRGDWPAKLSIKPVYVVASAAAGLAAVWLIAKTMRKGSHDTT